jgi:hypothetical protein
MGNIYQNKMKYFGNQNNSRVCQDGEGGKKENKATENQNANMSNCCSTPYLSNIFMMTKSGIDY